MPLVPTSFDKIQIDEMMLIADYGLGTEANLGPTRGGGVLNMEPTYRPIPYDGAPSDDVQKMVILDNVKITMSFTTLDWTTASLAKMFGFLELDTATLKALPRGVVPDANYLTNVTAFCRLHDGTYKKITLKTVLGTGPMALTGAPKAEGEIPVVLTAHYDPANPGLSPVEIVDVSTVAEIDEFDDYAGELTVTSVAGTAIDDTVLAVAEPNGFGKSFWYKLQANDTAPTIGSTGTGYTLLQQSVDISASTSTHVVVVEMGLDNIITRYGVVSLVKKA